MSKPLQVSHSRMKTWRYCQMAHYYKYVLNLEPKAKRMTLLRGTLVHACLEALALGQDWQTVFRDLFSLQVFLPEEQELKEELETMVPNMIKGYLRHWKNDPLFFEVVEHEFEPVEIKEGLEVVGKADGIVKDQYGLWLLERKTHRSFPTTEDRLLTSQALLYVHLARLEGYNVKGILWDYVRTKAPTRPGLLKSGELSRAKNIDTDWYTYRDTCLEHKLNPKDYADVIERLRVEKKDAFFQRHRQPIAKTALSNVVSDFRRDAIRLLAQQDKPTRNLGYACANCEFSRICSAELTGADPEFIVKSYYKPREKKNDKGAINEAEV